MAATGWSTCHDTLRVVRRTRRCPNQLEHADFIFPLYHELDSTSAAVADLYRRQLAPRVILYRERPTRLVKLGFLPPTHQIWRRLLEAQGVPANAIATIGPPVDTDVELGQALATGHRPRRGIVVTSRPQSRVARNALRRGLDGAAVDLRIHAVTPAEINPRAWWRSRTGWIAYFDAYCLWFLTFIR